MKARRFWGRQTDTRLTFVHNDIHDNLLAARCYGALAGEVINVGTGVQFSVNALCTLMAETLNTPHLPPRHLAERAGDLTHSFAYVTKCRAIPGYERVVPICAGLETTVAWYASEFRN